MPANTDRFNVAQSEASMLYPAVSQDELSDDSLLLSNYRHTMGRERILWGAVILIAGSWAVDYVRRGK